MKVILSDVAEDKGFTLHVAEVGECDYIHSKEKVFESRCFNAMKNTMNFEPLEIDSETLSELIKGLSEHDITQCSTNAHDGLSKDEMNTYGILKKALKDRMEERLPGMGFQRDPRHFTKDFPPNLLIDANASVFAEAASKIMCGNPNWALDSCIGSHIFDDNEDKNADIWDFIVFKINGLMEDGTAVYCKKHGKSVADLTPEEHFEIETKVWDLLCRILLETVLRGQQLPDIVEIAFGNNKNGNRTHEDYHSNNHDGINFYHNWYKDRTSVGEMVSLSECADAATEDHNEFNNPETISAITETIDKLDPQEKKLLSMMCHGEKQEDIASELGLKSQGAVSKRKKALLKKIEESIFNT